MPVLAAAEYAAGLTPREDQVLGLIGQGLTNRQIGDQLGIAEKTVKNTVTAVLSKLGFQRRGQAIIYVTVRRMSADQDTDRTAGRGRSSDRPSTG